MFWNKIAGVYDLIETIYNKKANVAVTDYVASLMGKDDSVLECACGTGMFSVKMAPNVERLTATDLSEGMLGVMRQKVARAGEQERINCMQGDCEALPFPDGAFDVATIAFGIRNFAHRETALREILRVLRPGGRLVILELSVPENRLLRWGYNLYFMHFVPWIGGLVSGDRAAYRYLPASVQQFPGRRAWMATMAQCGYADVRHRAFSGGICRMYVGDKESGSSPE